MRTLSRSTPTQTSSRRLAAVCAALALAGSLLAGCGSDETDSAGGSEDSPAAGGTPGQVEEGAYPVSIDSKFGTAEVTEAPERVVVVGLVEQDALLALGIDPVATTKWFGESKGGVFPWAEEALGDGATPEVLDSTNGIPVEKVAALRPDLIIGIYSGMTQEEYDLLSKLAPTIAQTEEVDYTESWQDTTLTVGQAVGRPQAAQDLVDDVEGQIEAAAEEHPEFAGKTAAVVTPYEGLGVYGAEDPRGRMLSELGFEFPEQLQNPDATEFFWSFSAERTSDLAGIDALVWLDYDAAPKAMVSLFEGTDTSREGRFFDISDEAGAYYVAQSMVTPLSIPYTLERYVPQLAAAVDGDPATEPPASAE